MIYATFVVAALMVGGSSDGGSGPLLDIPYRSDGTAGKLITLPVSVNGAAPRPFVLDTGAPRSALDPRLAEELRLPSARSSQEGGTGHGTVEAGHPGPLQLAIGKLAFSVDDPLTLSLKEVPVAREDRGLIGSELISRYVVRIDPVFKRVQVFNPSRFKPGKADVALPLGIDGEGRRFYVAAKLHVRPGLTVEHRLRIDTGSEDSVNDPIVGQAKKTTATTLGNGIGANFQGISGVYDSVDLGPYSFTYVWGPGGDLPAIGMELLRRFVVTFDAPHQRLYLRPTCRISEPVPPPF